jgi:hypothetical protein
MMNFSIFVKKAIDLNNQFAGLGSLISLAYLSKKHRNSKTSHSANSFGT